MASGYGMKHVLKRNIFIISFSLFFSVFVYLSAVIESTPFLWDDTLMTVLKIIFIYNTVLPGTGWIGTSGLIYFLNIFPSERIRLFLLLLYRSVKNFIFIHKDIIYSINSRIDLKSADKFLIPKYYLQNIITKDLYDYHLYQASLAVRIHSPVTGISEKEKTSVRDNITAVVLLCLLAAGFAAGFIK